MHIEFIATGEELLDGRTLNKNGSYLGEQLASIGLTLNRVTTIGDHFETLVETIQERLAKSDTLIISGGLGPTDDDRTRDAIATALNLKLEFRPEAMAYIESYFKANNRPMLPQNNVQAYAPETAKLILSGYGTAPGLHITQNDKQLIAFPGVPKELAQMFEADILPILKASAPPQKHIQQWTVYGVGESDLQTKFKDVYPLPDHLDIGFRAHIQGIQIQLTSTQDICKSFREISEKIQAEIKPHLVANDATTLAEVLAKRLTEKNETLAIAESCTGGLLAKTVTDLPGASQFFLESCITYSNERKKERLGVQDRTLSTHGAVSEAIAIEMAKGIQKETQSDCSISTTGIAGPSGGTPEKPVGTVWIAAAYKEKIVTKHLKLAGDRERIRAKTVSEGLYLLLTQLQSDACFKEKNTIASIKS